MDRHIEHHREKDKLGFIQTELCIKDTLRKGSDPYRTEHHLQIVNMRGMTLLHTVTAGTSQRGRHPCTQQLLPDRLSWHCS